MCQLTTSQNKLSYAHYFFIDLSEEKRGMEEPF